MVKALHRAGIEVILDVVYNHTAEGNHLRPDARLQGHRQRLVLPADAGRPEPLHGLHGHRQQPQPGAPERAAADHGLAALLGHGVPRRRLPLRPGLGAGARALRRRPPVGVLRRHPPGPGALAGQADRRAVGSRARRLPGRQLPGALDGVERPLPRHDARRLARRDERGGVRLALHRLERSLRGRRPAPVRLDQLRHRPRRLHARRPRLLQRRSTTRRTSRTTATAPTTTAPGTAASRARPTTPRSSRCASASSATSSPRCCSRRACRCSLAGDEIGRTQRGNNNAWCQDNEISWVDWELDEPSAELLEFTRRLLALRRRAPDLPSHAVPQRRGLGLGAARRLVVPARRPAHDRGRLAERRRARARRVPERPRDRERRRRRASRSSTPRSSCC